MGGAKPPWWAPRPPGSELEASDDGRSFRPIAEVPRSVADRTPWRSRRSARASSAWRSRRRRRSGSRWVASRLAPPAAARCRDRRARPAHGARVNRFQEKAAFATRGVPLRGGHARRGARRRRAQGRRHRPHVEDAADGTLDWTPPAGRWAVLRIGYSLTGQQNSPASPEATGLEVDKLNPAHVKAYFDNYLDKYKDATGGLMGKRGLQYVITRQLGSRGAELDRRDARRVHEAPRLRHAALAARPRRPRRRERRGQRPLPLGLPQDARRPDRREPLRPAHRPC